MQEVKNPNSVLLGFPCYLLLSCQPFLLKMCLFYATISLDFLKHITCGISLSWTSAGLTRDASSCRQWPATGWNIPRPADTLLPSLAPLPSLPSSILSWSLAGKNQLWESHGRHIRSQHVGHTASLLSILNFVFLQLLICLFTSLFICVVRGWDTCGFRGQPAGVFSLLLPCSSWARDTGCQA